VNRDQREPQPVEVDLRGFPGLTVVAHTTLTGDDPDATNTLEQPDRVTPRELGESAVSGGRLTVSLPALSWNMLRFRRASP
jgi:alpha-N-arabinofuranosidase